MDSQIFRAIHMSVRMLLVLGILSNFAMAGIPEFNAAARIGDYAAAAKETADAWEDYDKSRDSAVTIAREFAFVNYLAGDLETAADFIGNLVDDDSALTVRDDQPLTSRVLADLIELGLDSSEESRSALFQSLQARLQGEEAIDNISLLAARGLYSDDWAQGRLAEVEDSSALAISFFDRIGEGALVERHRAELIAVAADFVRWKQARSYDRLVDLHDAIVADVDRIADANTRESLISLKWVAQAWSNSAWIYLDTVNPQTGSPIDRVRHRELADSSKGYFFGGSTAADDPLPKCETTLDWNIRYPSAAAFRGMVGTVLVKMDFDSKGRAESHSLLASVPAESFGGSVVDNISKARLRPLKGQDADQCTLAIKGYMVTISFRL